MDKKGSSHNLLQVRTKVLNEELKQTFQNWYPGMKILESSALPEEEMAA